MILDWRDDVIPGRRTDGIIITMVGGEVIAFDQQNAQVHHLDATCTAVWNALASHHRLRDVTTAAGLMDDQVTRAAMEKLEAAGLLDGTYVSHPGESATSRRRLIRKAAIASTVPVIVSITAPIAANAQSICVPTDYLPDPNCCNKYILCDGGGRRSMFCPSGQMWNIDAKQCDFAQRVDCGSRVICS